MSLKYIENKDELINCKNKNIILDFTASWCGPCQMIGPELDKLSKLEEFEHITFFKVDVDNEDCADICSDFEIKCMPTIIYLKDEEIIDRVEGANLNNIIAKLLEHYPKDSKDEDEVKKEPENFDIKTN